MRLPSRDQTPPEAPVLSEVIWRASPPRALMAHSCPAPERPDSKRIQRPSGDQRGLLSLATALVSCRGGCCPSTEATQMCETDLLFCESVISVAAQATHMPVGSSEGAPMRRKANRSSTDMVRCCMAVSGVVLF